MFTFMTLQLTLFHLVGGSDHYHLTLIRSQKNPAQGEKHSRSYSELVSVVKIPAIFLLVWGTDVSVLSPILNSLPSWWSSQEECCQFLTSKLTYQHRQAFVWMATLTGKPWLLICYLFFFFSHHTHIMRNELLLLPVLAASQGPIFERSKYKPNRMMFGCWSNFLWFKIAQMTTVDNNWQSSQEKLLNLSFQ